MSCSDIRISACLECGSLQVKFLHDDTFRCEACGWKGLLKFLRGRAKKFYYMSMIKNKESTVEKASELMGISVDEMANLIEEWS